MDRPPLGRPGAGGAPLVETPWESWTVIFVLKQTGAHNGGLFQVQKTPASVHIGVFATGSAQDGTLSVEQNNDHAFGSEPNSALAALNQLEIVAAVADGHDRTISLYRQGNRTFITPKGRLGDVGKPEVFQILNNAQADVSLVEIANEAPSVQELDAETQRLAALYGVTGVAHVTEGAPATVPPVPVDNTRAWSTTPNFPVSNDLPIEKTPSLRDGLALAPGAVSLGYQDFTPGGNCSSRSQLDAQVYYNPETGNQKAVTGNDGIEGVEAFYARFRHYPADSPYNLHVFGPKGLSLRAVASQNNTSEGCTPGHIYGGMIREPTFILPGDIISVRYMLPKGPHAWTPIWLFEGAQLTPGPDGNPYAAGFNTPAALLHNETNGAAYYEYDLNDGYARYVDKVPVGHQLDTDYVTAHNTTFNVASYRTYTANGTNFTFHPKGQPPFSATNSIDLSSEPHNLVMAWRGDGSNLVDMYLDGKKYLQEYWEYEASSYTTPDGVSHQIPMHLIIGNQAVPSFLPAVDREHLVPDDGIPDGWSITIQEIKIIRGSIANDAATIHDANATPLPPNVPGPTPPSGQHAVTFNSHGVASTPQLPNQQPASKPFKVSATIAPTQEDVTTGAMILGMWGKGVTREWLFKLDAGGLLEFAFGDGKQNSSVKTKVPAGVKAGEFVTLEADVDPAAGKVTFWKTPVGSSRTQIGEVLACPPRPVGSNPHAQLRIGQDSTGANAFHGSFAAGSLTIDGKLVLNPVATADGIADGTGAVWTEYGTTVNQ